MAIIEVLAGDFLTGGGFFNSGGFTLRTKKHDSIEETIPIINIEIVDIATEENVKRLGGTVGWGVAGAILLGPVGLLAGLLLGGKEKEITFVVKFKDGRKLLASGDNATFTQIQSLVFNQTSDETIPSLNPTLSTSNQIEQLIKLGSLLDKGLITENEFKEYKKELNGSIETTTDLSENYHKKVTNQPEEYNETTHHISINNNKPTKKEPVKTKSQTQEIFQKIENDGYTFLSPLTVKQNGTENDFFVRQSYNKVELMSNGIIIKTYTL